jgi:hypothetical protein
VAEDQHDVARDLTALGRAVDPPYSVEGMTTAVMDRVATMPPPGRTGNAWTRARLRVGRWVSEEVGSRRRVVVVIVALLVALLLAPPVRATIADWFGFGGVRVERGTPTTGPAQPPGEVSGDRSPAEVAAEVDFTVWAPTELGPPDGAGVSDDRRIVSMSWTTDEAGVLRLDQFDARLDFAVLKTAPGVEYAAVGASDALWFEEPHEVALLERDGSTRTESARLAGHTLIWTDGVTTLRLEGDLTLERAVEIAESAVPVS